MKMVLLYSNDYSVLNKYNPKIVGQLTLPVDILEKSMVLQQALCMPHIQIGYL